MSTTSQRLTQLIQLKRIAVMTDLTCESERAVSYAASLARWYGSELLLVHTCSTEPSDPLPPEQLPTLLASGLSAKEEAELKLAALAEKLRLQDLAPRIAALEIPLSWVLEELDAFHPSLLVLASHGREGIEKWLMGSLAEEAFRKVRWPVLVLGPHVTSADVDRHEQFERILYATDLSDVSITALQYAAGLSRGHEAELHSIFVEPDPKQGFSFDRVIAQQRLQDWLQSHAEGFAEGLVGIQSVVDFGKPDEKILELAAQKHVDLIVLGARGMGAVSGLTSHFLGGTAYEVASSAGCPVLIVPQPR